MSYIESILNEGLLNTSHINLMYELFLSMCDMNKTELCPYDFYQYLSSQKEFSSIMLNSQIIAKEYSNNLFMKIDYGQDGLIDFDDFCLYVSNCLKCALISKAEVGESKFYFSLRSFVTLEEIRCFYEIIKRFIIKDEDSLFLMINEYNRIVCFNYEIEQFFNKPTFYGTITNGYAQSDKTNNFITLYNTKDLNDSFINSLMYFNNESTYYEYINFLASFDGLELSQIESIMSTLKKITNGFTNIKNITDISSSKILRLILSTVKNLLHPNFTNKLLKFFINIDLTGSLYGNNIFLVLSIIQFINNVLYLLNTYLNICDAVFTNKHNVFFTNNLIDFIKDNYDIYTSLAEYSVSICQALISAVDKLSSEINERFTIIINYLENQHSAPFDIINLFKLMFSYVNLSETLSQSKPMYLERIFKKGSLLKSFSLSLKYLYDKISLSNQISEEEAILFRKFCFYIIRLLTITYNQAIQNHFLLSSIDNGSVIDIFTDINNMLNKLFNYYKSTSDVVFQVYYIILSSLLSRKLSLENDKEILQIIHKVIEEKVFSGLNYEDVKFIIKSYFFYLKSMLLNTNKKDTVFILSESKVFDFILIHLLPATKGYEDIFSSYILEVISLVFSNKSFINNLELCSAMMQEIIYIFDTIVKFDNYSLYAKTASYGLIVKFLSLSSNSSDFIQFIIDNTTLLDRLLEFNFIRGSLMTSNLVLNHVFTSENKYFFNIFLLENSVSLLHFCFTGQPPIYYPNANSNNKTKSGESFSLGNSPITLKTIPANKGNSLMKFYVSNLNKLISYKYIKEIVELFYFIINLKANANDVMNQITLEEENEYHLQSQSKITTFLSTGKKLNEERPKPKDNQREAMCFLKYFAIADSNIMLMIIEILRVITIHLEEIFSLKVTSIDIDLSEIKRMVDYCISNLATMERHYKEKYFSDGYNVIYDIVYDHVTLSIQNEEEKIKGIYSLISIRNDQDINLEMIKNQIEDNYSMGELNVYYLSSLKGKDNKNNRMIKIKNDQDFEECLQESTLESRALRKKEVIMELFVHPVDKQNVRLIVKCIGCGVDFSVKSNDVVIDRHNIYLQQNSNYCDKCKNFLLSNLTMVQYDKSSPGNFNNDSSSFMVNPLNNTRTLFPKNLSLRYNDNETQMSHSNQIMNNNTMLSNLSLVRNNPLATSTQYPVKSNQPMNVTISNFSDSLPQFSSKKLK